MALKLLTGPTVEPLTVDEVRENLRVDSADQNTTIRRLIKAARQHVENITGRALITQTWRLYRKCFSMQPIRLPKPMLQAILQIQYVDASGATITLDPSAYLVDSASEPALLTPAWGIPWPIARSQLNAVWIDFRAGYGDTPEKVPEGIRNAMLLHIGDSFRFRETYGANASSATVRAIGSELSAFQTHDADDE